MHELSFKCDNVLINSCVNTSICAKCVGSIRTCKDSTNFEISSIEKITLFDCVATPAVQFSKRKHCYQK